MCAQVFPSLGSGPPSLSLICSSLPVQMGGQQAPPGLGPILEDQARPSQNLVRTGLVGPGMGWDGPRGCHWFPAKGLGTLLLSLTPVSLPTSSSSAHLSPSLRAPWGPLGPQGSPSPKVPPRRPQGLPKALLEQLLAHPLLDPFFDPRTLGPTLSCGASSSTHHR